MIMAAGFTIRIVLFAGVYLACAGAGSVVEWLVAMCAGGAGAALATALGRSGRPYAARLGDFARRSPGIVASILRDALRLTAAFGRFAMNGAWAEGTVVTRPFDPGAGMPAARSRRSFVLAAVALAPNTVPVAIDYENGALLVHRLLPATEPEDRRWPM